MLDVGWLMLEERLAARVDELARAGDRFLIVESVAPFAYVQFAFDEEGVYGEAVSNTYLTGADRLSAGQEARLAAFGWSAPGVGGPCCRCCVPSPPNWHRQWPAWQGSHIVAQVGIVTLRCVYRVADPDGLSLDEVERQGDAD